jgi:ubiquinone/menaquinone biosynthesis C-methylase UbiE
MSAEADRLRQEQYKDASNLNARLELHRRFSVNPRGWSAWLFDQLLAAVPQPGARLFEAGCGPATLWSDNRERIPASWSLTLSDFSAGMLHEARRVLSERAAYTVADVQALPSRGGRFDVAVANHMIYHVPDRAGAIAELARVLAPDGCLVASTVGEGHMAELTEPLRRHGIDIMPLSGATQEFTLENGAAQLEASFAEVQRIDYDDALRVTEVEPLLAYLLSMRSGAALTREVADELRADFSAEIERCGFASVTKSSGVFVARQPRR